MSASLMQTRSAGLHSRPQTVVPHAPVARHHLHQNAAGVAAQKQHAPSRSVQTAVSTQPSQPAPGNQGDVYIYEPIPLKEGEEKHVISVFVADESGLINRVAGVFARRGANIESLAVGLNVDKALFTIVMTGTAATVANLVKQLSKLVKVRYVEDITRTYRVERELMLLKLRAPAGPARTEVLQLAEIFRARVVDVSERCLTLCVSGDPGKTLAMQKVMSKFGIIEVARTGRICLKRGEELLEGRDLEGRVRRTRGSLLPAAPEDRDPDVYGAVASIDEAGVWEVGNLLDPTFGDDLAQFQAHTLSIDVQDVPGVLNQVTGVFARRGYNVQSLAVGPGEREGLSRITMVVPGSTSGIANLLKQLNKLVAVQSVTDLTDSPYVNRELMLVKVRCSASQRSELRDVIEIFRASIVDISHGTMTLEVQGKDDKMKALCDLLEPYGILELARTGKIALSRESGVDTRYLETMRSGRVW